MEVLRRAKADRRLAIHRTWAVLLTLLSAALLLVLPAVWWTLSGRPGPAFVLVVAGALAAWLLAFVRAWVTGTRLKP
ncbi:hypothetical protein [Amycolatopsis sp. NPDC059021]|uniref:hypothetical protein n=1 Tax=Amycolatopsis sp. NPDC059021 TaxID=3346704 RepID=UPI00366AAF5A